MPTSTFNVNIMSNVCKKAVVALIGVIFCVWIEQRGYNLSESPVSFLPCLCAKPSNLLALGPY